MHSTLAKRVAELVEFGWEPQTTTETTASLAGRRDFSWWLFLIVIIFFPLFGGILYLIFWLSTSRATVFLYQEGDEVISNGDLWLVEHQETRKEAVIDEQRKIKERGFLTVMWPKLLAFLVLLALWVLFIQWYF